MITDIHLNAEVKRNLDQIIHKSITHYQRLGVHGERAKTLVSSLMD